MPWKVISFPQPGYNRGQKTMKFLRVWVFFSYAEVLNIHSHTALLSHFLNSGFYPSLDYGPYTQLYITNATKPWQSSGKQDDNLVARSIRPWCTTLHFCLSGLRWQSRGASWKNLMHNSSFYTHFIEKTGRHLQIATGIDYSGYNPF